MGKPNRIKIAGRTYRPLVLHLKSRDAKGRPKEVTIVHDDETVHLEGGEEFEVVFAREDFTRPKN